ncbi:hypothetical protein SXCC_02986 [Gluconacetobacter sp. SXCC-1]|nr:hypothetical protein SXCC_02986 [Gluconacetobacter sp. SXCC-1]
MFDTFFTGTCLPHKSLDHTVAVFMLSAQQFGNRPGIVFTMSENAFPQR